MEAATGEPGSAIQLHDGTIITGATSELLGCSAAMLLNALKYLAGIDSEVHLLSVESIEPIQTLKTVHLGSRNPRLHTDEVLIALSVSVHLGSRNPRLHTDEVLIALSVSAASNEDSRLALEQLKQLRGCDVHTTTILGSVDETIFRNLGILVTSDPKFQRKKLYQKR